MRRPAHRTFPTLALVAALALAPVLAAAPLAAQRQPGAAEQLDFGVDMAKRGLWSEALFRFEQAEKLSPGNPRILNNLAVAYEAVGRFDEALDYYQQALKASPSNRGLKKNYSAFIQFYQGFKPDEQETVDEAAGADDAEEEAEPAADEEEAGASADGAEAGSG